MGARRELGQPRTQTGRLLRARLQDGTRPLHEKSSQVRVPAFADPEQSLLAGGGIFARESAAAPQQIRERLLKARKLLGAAGGNPGACGPGMGCAGGG